MSADKLKQNLEKYSEPKVNSMLKEKKEEMDKIMKEHMRAKRF